MNIFNGGSFFVGWIETSPERRRPSQQYDDLILEIMNTTELELRLPIKISYVSNCSQWWTLNSIILKSPNQLSNGLHCFSFSHPTRSIRRIVGLSSEIISIIFIIHIITNNLIITIIIISNSSKLTNNCVRHTRILVITQILARAKLSTARLVFGNLGWKLLSVLKIDLVPRPGSTFGWKLVLENHFAPRALNPRTFL